MRSNAVVAETCLFSASQRIHRLQMRNATLQSGDKPVAGRITNYHRKKQKEWDQNLEKASWLYAINVDTCIRTHDLQKRRVAQGREF